MADDQMGNTVHRKQEVQTVERLQMNRQIWLLYFNRILLEKQLITEEHYRSMYRQILGNTDPG